MLLKFTPHSKEFLKRQSKMNKDFNKNEYLKKLKIIEENILSLPNNNNKEFDNEDLIIFEKLLKILKFMRSKLYKDIKYIDEKDFIKKVSENPDINNYAFAIINDLVVKYADELILDIPHIRNMDKENFKDIDKEVLIHTINFFTRASSMWNTGKVYR